MGATAMMRAIVSAMLLALAGMATSPVALAEKRVALVIGNSDYEQVTRLANPANDAADMAAALEEIGFDEVTLALDLDHGAMRATLGEFTRTAAGADIAVVYFAGHGIEVGGTNYLIPTDATLAHVDDVEFEAVALSTALHALNRAGKLKLVILDACRNNPFVPEMDVAGATRSIGRGLARVEPQGSDTLIAYAAREGTVAEDGDGANSPYAAALINHLATPGLDVRILFGRVRDEVRAATGGAQEPFIYGSLGGEEIVLAAAAGGGVPGGNGARADPAAGPSEAGEAWNAVKDTDIASDLEALIAAFPDSFYARLAASRLERLKELEDRVAVGVFPAEPELQSSPDRGPKPGDEFQDCDACPQMVVVPAGSLLMGSPASETDRGNDEGPQHTVSIAKPFAVGKFEVTFSEWDACVADGGCNNYRPGDEGWGRGRRPVIHVSWDDARAYVAWLARKTDKGYRLLSEAEWEYAARAETVTPFYTGQTITTDQANFDGNYTYGGSRKGSYREQTVSVGTFAANAFGLHDMHGKVWEWVEDCWDDSYASAPGEGSARTTGNCSQRVLRGGSWYDEPWGLRSDNRIRLIAGSRSISSGFRVARTLIP
jgi:formylglycine-generating enzyme required for sulfatase activity